MEDVDVLVVVVVPLVLDDSSLPQVESITSIDDDDVAVRLNLVRVLSSPLSVRCLFEQNPRRLIWTTFFVCINAVILSS